ncbi:hypothetical protein JCM3774_006017 [Rhodotorula dairenensis]
MAVEEKPLRVYTHVPTSSQGSAAGLLTATSGSPTSPTAHPWTAKATRLAVVKRKWIAVAAVYAVLVLAWHQGWPPAWLWRRQQQAGSSIRTRPGERVVFDAYGGPHVYPPLRTSDSAAGGATDPVTNTTKGSTSLGPEADKVYHLSDPDPALYLHTLEQFLFRHFPTADTDASDPNSLLSALRSFFPAPSEPPYAGTIPHRIFMTAANQQGFTEKERLTRTWAEKNGGWDVTKQDDQQADAWVRSRFVLQSDALDSEGNSSSPGSLSGTAGIVAAWDRLSEPAVLRSDFWRYLVLAVDGGVYTDTDVECLKPIEQWGEDPDWWGSRPADYREPALIVGVEADVGNRHDWHEWWPRPLQISQWTIASARGHPVMIDTVRRVVEMALEDEKAAARSVMERTGPGPFTDAVLSYLLVQYRKPWGELRELGGNGWRFRASRDAPELLRASRYGGDLPERWGDTKVLSITGFSPGVGHMGSADVSDPAAMAQHGFAGSWRSQKGADI